jgi:hypothetical protein
MLILTIWTWEPENRERLQKMAVEVRQRVQKMSAEEKEKFKRINMLGEWHDVSGNRMFTLQDATDPSALIEANQDWLKYAKAEYFNVIDAKDLYKIAEKYRVVR